VKLTTHPMLLAVTGMCELVQELGLHYQMQPEALANNVIFTIGKLAHKHSENAKLLTRSSIPLIVQSLKLYGMDKVTPFALRALYHVLYMDLNASANYYCPLISFSLNTLRLL
jgi:hypothetical protein